MASAIFGAGRASRDIEAQARLNFIHLVFDIAWFGIALAATSRFVSVFAIRLGAEAWALGLISSLPALVLLFSSLWGEPWRARFSDSTKAIGLPTFGFRLVFLLPFFTPFLPPAWHTPWLIFSAAAPAIPQGVASVIFMTLMREAVPPERMTSLFSRRSVAMHLALAGGALAFGYWLEYAPFPQGYQAMFLFAFAMAMLSQWHVHQVRPLPALLAPPPTQKNALPYGSPWRDPAFLRVAVTVGLSYVAFSAALPVIPLWLVENLGAKEGFVALFSMVELLSAASGAFMAAYFIRRLKHKPHIALAMAGSGLGVLLIALAPSLWFTLIGAGLMGACWAASDVGLLGLFALRAPQHDAYSRAYSQLVAGGLFFGPLVTSGLAQRGLELWWVLVLAALLRVLAGVCAVIGKRRPTT